jgi:uncharacterized protein YraI
MWRGPNQKDSDMKHPAALGLLAITLSALAGAVQAQGQAAYTAKSVNLRAGPARDYPVVAILPAGLQISVEGCVADYTWCDVLAGPSRGWVWAGNINYYYQNSYVPLLNYGTVIGISIFPFILDDYWGSHYHDRPWYPDRYRWADRHPPARIHPPSGPGYVAPRQRPPSGSGWVAPQQRPPSGSGWVPPRAQPPGTVPQQPHAPGQRVYPPGAAPQQPRAPGGVPSVAPRPSTRPAPGVAPARPSSGSGWYPGSQEPPAK